jgi:dUTP pyrophosphatase
MALPEGYVALVHPRSGLAARHGISIVNAPGTIDAGYRGEVQVCLVNTDRDEPFEVRRGDRIAQLVIQRFETAAFVEADDLPESARGAGGYGSTGGFATGTGEPSGPAGTQTQHPGWTRAGGTAR